MIDPTTLLERLGIEYGRRGSKLIAVCPHPDHPDRKPSWAAWSDNLDRFRHRCLSCGFGGGPVSLVMAVLGLDTARAAYDFLESSEQAGPPPPLHVRVEVRDRTVVGPDAIPEEVWFASFDEWPAPPRRYLEQRGFGPAVVARWGLGYAVDGKLAGRIWIPVRDRRGDLASWTARSFIDAPQKYDSSTRAAHHVLLGENTWAGFRRVNACVVVEGPFDAFAVDAACEVAVAALRGSASGQTIDPGHASKLAEFDEIVVATDPDAAGKKAAGMLSGLGRWSRVRKVAMPVFEDCAKVFERSPAALAELLGLPPRTVGRPTVEL